MNDAKCKRIIVASTVGAVVLVAVLLIVMIYQLIAIGVSKKEAEEYELQKAEYVRLIEEGETTLAARSQRRWLAKRARELGYSFETDITD